MTLDSQLLPIADIESVLRAIVPLIVIVLWVLSQVFSGDEKKKPQPRNRQPVDPPQPEGEASVREELQEFLREAAQRRGGANAEPIRAEPIRAELVEAEIVEPVAVATLVHRHPSIAERVSHLGEEVGLADEKVEQRLHQVFDHSVSRLRSSTSEPDATTDEKSKPSLAQEFRDLFRRPESVRRAIVMNEVLRRPEENW